MLVLGDIDPEEDGESDSELEGLALGEAETDWLGDPEAEVLGETDAELDPLAEGLLLLDADGEGLDTGPVVGTSWIRSRSSRLSSSTFRTSLMSKVRLPQTSR